jgi:tetratricopeptide (TPR) repeat protein
MKKTISLLIALFFVPFFLFSQEISIKKAVELMDKEEYALAEEVLISISTHSENNVKAYYYLGVLYTDVYGKHKESLVFFDSSIDAINADENYTDKDLALPYYGMGSASFEMGKYDISYSFYERAYKKDKTLSLSIIGMAMAEQALGDYKSSLKTLKKVKDIEEDEIKLAYYELSAFAHYVLNNYKESLVFYTLLLDIDNEVAYYHLLKGMSEMWLGFEEEANKSLLQSLELNNTDPETYLGLAIWLDVYKDGEVEKIIEHCTKAIELDNKMADAHYMRAFVKTKTYEADVVYKKIFTLEEIIADFETCIELDKSFNESYFGMAYAYKLFDQKEKACNAYKKGLSLISLPQEYKFLKKEMMGCK